MIELNRIYNEDCLEGLKRLPDNSVDLTVTSPPYFNAKEYSHWETYESYMCWLKDVFTETFRVMKQGRMCCVNISTILVARKSRNSESSRVALPFHFVSLMESVGFKFLEDIIWVKPEGAAKNRNGGFFQHRQPVAYKPNVINEYIFVFQKPSKFLIDKIVRSYKGQAKENSLVRGEYERSNIWYINPETKSKHPAPYPKKLCENIIKYYSYEGDVVLDMFMGSGTTAIACINTNRNYIGFELDKYYYEAALQRIKRETAQMTLLDTPNVASSLLGKTNHAGTNEKRRK